MRKPIVFLGLALMLASCSSGLQVASESEFQRQAFTATDAWNAVKAKLKTDANGTYIPNPDFGGHVITEGQSYVMMLAVQMNDQTTFNNVWKWTKAKMQNSDGLFAWRVDPTNGNKVDTNSAPDGEEYMITALIFAHGRWGNTTNLTEARNLQNVVKQKLFVNGGTYNGMVKFTQVNNFTDPSYHLPAFYTVWAKVADKYGWGTGSFWRAAATTSRKFITSATDKFRKDSGLTPDYANYDGSGYSSSWYPESNQFRYDAFRTAMNWSVDFMWNGNADTVDLKSSTKSWNILDFFNRQDVNPNDSSLGYQSLCKTDGTCSGGKKAGHVAMNAVASLIVPSHPRAADFKNALLNQNPSSLGYYDLMLHSLGTLIVMGNYKQYLR